MLLLAAVVAVAPGAARAEVPAPPGQLLDFGNYSADPQWQASFVNEAMCDGSATLQLEWNVGSTPPTNTTTYQLFASSKMPAAGSGSPLALCATQNDASASPPTSAGQIGSGTQTTAIGRSTQVTGVDATTAAGMACGGGSELQVFYVCAHLLQGATPMLSAAGKFIIQTQAPEPPVDVNVTSVPDALVMTWTPATGGATAAARFVVFAVPVDADGQPVPGEVIRSAAAEGTVATLGALGYERTYRVTVVAYSVGGNPSAESAPVLAQTAPDYLHASGGVPIVRSKGGGCGTGGAGALSLLAVAALALAGGRRRKRATP